MKKIIIYIAITINILIVSPTRANNLEDVLKLLNTLSGNNPSDMAEDPSIIIEDKKYYCHGPIGLGFYYISNIHIESSLLYKIVFYDDRGNEDVMYYDRNIVKYKYEADYIKIYNYKGELIHKHTTKYQLSELYDYR